MVRCVEWAGAGALQLTAASAENPFVSTGKLFRTAPGVNASDVSERFVSGPQIDKPLNMMEFC